MFPSTSNVSISSWETRLSTFCWVLVLVLVFPVAAAAAAGASGTKEGAAKRKCAEQWSEETACFITLFPKPTTHKVEREFLRRVVFSLRVGSQHCFENMSPPQSDVQPWRTSLCRNNVTFGEARREKNYIPPAHPQPTMWIRQVGIECGSRWSEETTSRAQGEQRGIQLHPHACRNQSQIEPSNTPNSNASDLAFRWSALLTHAAATSSLPTLCSKTYLPTTTWPIHFESFVLRCHRIWKNSGALFQQV